MREQCSYDVRVYKRVQGKETKGNNSVITIDRVMVLVHCTSSYCPEGDTVRCA